MPKRKKTLVIAPTVAIVQWRNEFSKFTSGFKVDVWHGQSRSTDIKKIQEFDVVLTSCACTIWIAARLPSALAEAHLLTHASRRRTRVHLQKTRKRVRQEQAES